jgi:hypothetical protein
MNRAFRLVPAGTSIQTVRFEAKKSKQRKKNMASLDNLFAALASLDPATLLNTAVILLDIPSKILERFSVGFRCIKEIGSPVFCFPVGMNNPEHLDETILTQVYNSSFGRDVNIRNRAVMRVIRVYQPIGFESGAPVPLQRADQFQVVDT